MPAFSATTLSIPQTPADNFDKIVAWSREHFSRARATVEEEIRETIEQSEKYKRELSDSGRQEEAPVFMPITSEGATIPLRGQAGNDVHRPYTEQKPNYKHAPTPQGDFRRTKMSPNEAEGKERPGLKDLAKLAGTGAGKPQTGKRHKRRAKGSER